MPTSLPRFIRESRYIPGHIFIALSFCALFHFSLPSRAQNNTDEATDFYMNLNGGFGILYGGFGGNLEAGSGHFSGFGSLGYATRRVFDTITIVPSLNYQFGLRYYFDTGNEFIFPRVGLGYGWITNYYNENIGNLHYKQHVNGLILHLGLQFYTSEGLVFNFDLGMASKYAIANPESHPYFYTFYIRPTIGVGYDFTHLFSKSKKGKHIRNKEINPFQ